MKKYISQKSEEKLFNELLAKLGFKEVKNNKNTYNYHYRNDWNYICINCDYEQERNCEEYGCDYICRCGKITSTKTINFDIIGMVDNLTYGFSNDILISCIDRIVRLKKIDEENFEAVTCGGYYGEEIAGVYLDESIEKDLRDKISALKDLSDIERIKYILNLEYGYLLEELNNCYDVYSKEIDVELVNIQRDYSKKIDLTEEYYNEKYELPRGIYLKTGNKYRLIDGYHRFLKAKSIGMENIKGIVLE